MLEIRENNIFEINKNVSLKNINGEVYFILNSDSGKQYNLTEMEYEIVDMLAKGCTTCEIVDNIASKYNEKKEQIIIDLTEYIDSLLEAGLIIKK